MEPLLPRSRSRLSTTIPALPVRDTRAAATYYRERFAFAVGHLEGGFALVRRDAAELHLWQAGDEGWRTRDDFAASPVRSGAETFLAGTASCRITVDDVDALWAELRGSRVLHPVSHAGVTETDFGSREFATLDLDGNLLTFVAGPS